MKKNTVKLSALKCLMFCFAVMGSITGVQAASPNIILILTDDMNYGEEAFMPNLNALIGDQGVTYSNSYVPNAVCCPSRVSTLRGQYVHNHGVFTNQPPEGGFQRFQELGLESSTVATWLQRAGYRTGLFGKYLNGYPDKNAPEYVPWGWDEWHAFMQGNNYYKYKMNSNGVVYHYGENPEDYSTDVLSGLLDNFIDEHSNDPRPFFAYVAPHANHSPATPAPRHEDAFPGMVIAQKPSYNEEDVSDKPLYVQELAQFGPSKASQMDDFYRRRLQSLLAVDDMIARLVAQLEAIGQLDNTYIFFTSDNGILLGEHRFVNAKGVPYEEAIHVPLMVRGPGLAAGKLNSDLVLNIDLAPTFAKVAGVDAPDFVDGIALGRRDDALPPSQQRVLLDQPLAMETPDFTAPAYSGLRTRRHTYVEYDLGERELYDMDRDFYQLDNYFPRVTAGLKSQLETWLNELRDCSGVSCRIGR